MVNIEIEKKDRYGRVILTKWEYYDLVEKLRDTERKFVIQKFSSARKDEYTVKLLDVNKSFIFIWDKWEWDVAMNDTELKPDTKKIDNMNDTELKITEPNPWIKQNSKVSESASKKKSTKK